MGKIVLLIGPSNSGKDTMFKLVKEKISIPFENIILHTTRPKRSNEVDGREYYFCTERQMKKLLKNDEIIERRSYNTVHGIWYYFTSSKNFDLENNNYLGLNTLMGLDRYLKYFGEENIISLFLQVDDGVRLQRALDREKMLEVPDYKEMCRRYMADCEDFSLENLQKRKVSAIIDNNGTSLESLEQINKVLQKHL